MTRPPTALPSIVGAMPVAVPITPHNMSTVNLHPLHSPHPD